MDEDFDLEQESVTAGDMDNEVDEAPLDAQEERDMMDNIMENHKNELMELFGRVKGMKLLTDNAGVRDAFFRVVDGNIAMLAHSLETIETKDLKFAQGQLDAYKKMRDFPKSSVEMFNERLDAVKRDNSLFLDDSFVQGVIVNYDETTHTISISEPDEEDPGAWDQMDQPELVDEM